MTRLLSSFRQYVRVACMLMLDTCGIVIVGLSACLIGVCLSPPIHTLVLHSVPCHLA